MEIWAWVGFAVVVIVTYLFSVRAMNFVSQKSGWESNIIGFVVVVWTAAYASFITWMLTAGRVPFISG